MTKDQATNRPWQYDPNESGSFVVGTNGHEVCDVLIPLIRDKGYDKCSELRDANAQLIVTAVNEYDGLISEIALKTAVINRMSKVNDELVEALEYCIKGLDMIPVNLNYDEQIKAMERAKKALAKAGAL